MSSAKRDRRRDDEGGGGDRDRDGDDDVYDYAKEFGRRVRALRLQLGLSQEALGERSRLHRTYVGRLERGELNPSLHNVVRLAAGLGVDVTELVRSLRLEGSGP